jgi:class 3 adenylate cyclase
MSKTGRLSKTDTSSVGVVDDDDDDDDDDDSISGGGLSHNSSVGPMTSAKARAAKQERANLGKNETKVVRCLRIVTLLILLGTAGLVSWGVYSLSAESQADAFKSEYDSHATKLIDSFHSSVERFLGSFGSFSASITSYATDDGLVFPNVTIPDFEVRSSGIRVLGQASIITYMPLVTDETRLGWEAYATANQGYLLPSFLKEMQLKTVQDIKYGYVTPEEAAAAAAGGGSNRKLQLESVTDQSFREQIWGTTGAGETEAPGTGPYLPLWQFSPTLPLINLLNMNTRDLFFFRDPFDQTLATGQASFGVMTHLDDPEDENGETTKILNAMLSQGEHRHAIAQYTADPITIVSYPVFDSFDVDRKVVAVLGTMLYWKLLFTDVLPDAAVGFIVVVENTFGQAESYLIDGANVTYLGSGDLHDPTYDHMVVTQDVTDYVTARAGPASRSYTAVDLNSDYVGYTVSVYPSEELENIYLTNEPVYYAVGVALIFLFTTIVFLIFSCIVERRQAIVLDRAVKSTAVVKSLFPENVQNRLYEEAEKDEEFAEENAADKGWTNSGKAEDKLSSFISGAKLGSSCVAKGSPIADLFPEATVFFADLSGFTKWSSDRQPVEVFGFLETLYCTFDAIATRRQVFKVETIGDCYVAVTGVPQAQAEHATIMAKFAAECLLKSRTVVISMADDYGEETKALSLRVGIHSGPVTAGVLRGERARFQLFGDTVNTAARMESHGSPGRIHCSQDTAKELFRAGRGSWMKRREDTIVAKGKGEMVTYWIEPSKSKTLQTGTTLSSSNHVRVLMEKDSDGDVQETTSANSDWSMLPGLSTNKIDPEPKF